MNMTDKKTDYVSVYFKGVDSPHTIKGSKKIIDTSFEKLNKCMAQENILVFYDVCTINGKEIRMITRDKI